PVTSPGRPALERLDRLIDEDQWAIDLRVARCPLTRDDRGRRALLQRSRDIVMTVLVLALHGEEDIAPLYLAGIALQPQEDRPVLHRAGKLAARPLEDIPQLISSHPAVPNNISSTVFIKCARRPA